MEDQFTNNIINKKCSIAVIMSVYRGDDAIYFQNAIDSVLKQEDISKFDLHVYLGIDGPISEEMHDAIYKRESEIYKIFEFRENRGLSYVLNDLIDCLDDEVFIFRMDADDICHPQRFIRQLRFMDRNVGIDVLGTAIWEMQGNKPQRLIRYPLEHGEAVAAIHKRSPFAHPTVCFRRRVFDIVEAGYPHTNLCEDVALWFTCIRNDLRFGNLAEPLLYFRVNENFWKRRGMLRAKSELMLWTKGVWGMYGFNWRLAFPMMRFLYRLSPGIIQKWGYRSKWRAKNADSR